VVLRLPFSIDWKMWFVRTSIPYAIVAIGFKL